MEIATPKSKPKEKMLCPICDKQEWQDLDDLRNVEYWYDRDKLKLGDKVGFQICLSCGFVTYEPRCTESELKEYYGDSYRKAVSGAHVTTCNRKNLYHKAFLDEEMKAWAKAGKSLVDYGCAQGAFLKMLRDSYGFDQKNLYGTEWTSGFREWARQMYGIKVTEEIDKTKKYDVISLYRVLEHLQDPDVKLRDLMKLLKPGGVFYISIPIWFDYLQNPPGGQTNDFEDLFHIDHINTFSWQSIKNLLNKVGLKVVKEDKVLYDYTFLAVVDKPTPIKPENPQKIIKSIGKQKKAIEYFATGRFYEACDVYPKYPEAIVAKSVNKENFRDFQSQIEILETGRELCPVDYRIIFRMAEVYMQWDETRRKDDGGEKTSTNNIKKAEQLMHKALEMKPGSEDIHFYIAVLEYLYKKDLKSARLNLEIALLINPCKFMEFRTFQGHMISGMPLPGGQEATPTPPPDRVKMRMTTAFEMQAMKRAMGVY